MTSAVERLATELMNLSVDEWDRLVELRLASQDQDAAVELEADVGIAEDSLQRETPPAGPADQAHSDFTPSDASERRMVARGTA